MKYYVFDNETYGKKFFKGTIDIPDKILANTDKMMQMIHKKFPKLGKNIFVSQRKFRTYKPKNKRSVFIKEKHSRWENPEDGQKTA
ncbi:MAG: hypothetical protein WC976_07110 [Caldisericia bacterium]